MGGAGKSGTVLRTGRHGAAFADNPLGPFIPVRRKLFTVDGCDFPGEDPFVFTVNGRLFCILKDNGRNYSGLLKALLLFESQDGLTWEKAGIALSRNIPCENGHKKRFFPPGASTTGILQGSDPPLLCSKTVREKRRSVLHQYSDHVFNPYCTGSRKQEIHAVIINCHSCFHGNIPKCNMAIIF